MSTPIVHNIRHSLVQHKLTLMRQKDRSTNNFRRLLHEISMLMAYEVTRDMPTQMVEIETPVDTMQAPMIDGKKTLFVVIMRAGSVAGVGRVKETRPKLIRFVCLPAAPEGLRKLHEAHPDVPI